MSVSRLSQMRADTTRVPPLPWARIGAVAGAASDYTYTDAAGITWRVVQWNASTATGLTLAVSGLVEALIVSGGGGGQSGVITGTGAWNAGLLLLPAGTLPVVVGAAGRLNSGDNNNGGPSSIGAYQSASGGGYAGDRSNGPLVSSITGAPVSYCTPGLPSPQANRGDGGSATGGVAGSTGAVIIRVPV